VDRIGMGAEAGQDLERFGMGVTRLREWSVTTLAAHGGLDEAQIAAARRFCSSWETVQGQPLAAATFAERIDRDRNPPTYSDRRLKAAADLRHCRILLGEHGYALVGKVCGDGYHIRDLYPTRRERDFAADLLKVHLTALAAMWR
jgi:hypothetical protein